jgi:hypothetical protein
MPLRGLRVLVVEHDQDACLRLQAYIDAWEVRPSIVPALTSAREQLIERIDAADGYALVIFGPSISLNDVACLIDDLNASRALVGTLSVVIHDASSPGSALAAGANASLPLPASPSARRASREARRRRLREIFDADAARAAAMIDDAHHLLRADARQIEASIGRRDADAVLRIAERMRSIAAEIGSIDLVEVAVALERHARANDWIFVALMQRFIARAVEQEIIESARRP